MDRTERLHELVATVWSRDKGQKTPSGRSDRDLALAALQHLNPARAEGYHSWLGVGMALHSVDPGFLAAWEEWSARCPDKYTLGACARKWQSFDGSGIGLGSLIFWARQDGWDGKSPRDGNRRDPRPPTEDEKPTNTDTGNAQRLVKEHGVDLRFCHPMGNWYAWRRSHWSPDDTGEVMRRSKETIRRHLAWATELLAKCANDDERKTKLAAMATWFLKSLDARRLKAMVELARSEPGIPILPAEMDRDPWLLNVRNGTLDLRNGNLRKHSREDYITRVCPIEYIPTATCSTWDRCLERWLDGNQDVIGYLERAVGHCLTGDVSEQCLFFLHGDGANGKSTFLEAVLAVVGDYGIQAIAELLMQRHGETHPTERADLHGRRFVATIETEDGPRMAEALVKQLTGGDRIRARKMRQDFWEFKPTHKIWLAANHKPNVQGTDFAIWRRIKLIPFTVTIPPEDRDPQLGEKLKSELPGILAWAVRGCLRWQENGLGEPEEVRIATDQYRAEQDVIGAWLAECCVTGRDYRCRASELLASLMGWCKTTGEGAPTQRQFGRRLESLGFAKYTSNGTWYKGVAVRTEGTEGTEPEIG